MPRLMRSRPFVDAGYRRLLAGRGFRYADSTGRPPTDDDSDRIRELVIPPAWNEVWVAKEPLAHIQAVGADAAGRRQYLYHEQWRARRDHGKFARTLRLAAALPHARGRVTRALRSDDIDRDHVLAVAFRLLDVAAPRIGSSRYLQRHGSRGLTTLERRNVSIAESLVTLTFPGKSGKRALIEIDDPDLALALTPLAAGRPGRRLLSYPAGRRRVALTPQDVNAHIRDLTGDAFTAKDFRTLRGTILAAESLAHIGSPATARDTKAAELLAVRATADALGNTPAVARGSYIHPGVFAAYRKGRLLDLSIAPESAIRALLSHSRTMRY